jgi:hypothetical protein
MNAYAVAFETDYAADWDEAIQTFVLNHKDANDHRYSVVPMSENEGVYSCKLLQTYTDVTATTPKNINKDVDNYTYIVMSIDAGTPSNALNHTMKTVTKLSPE